jgi:mannose-6-phosphate isomerase-like protein (cupin superfamily)
MVTQQVLAGVGVPIHRHLQMDETFYVLEGGGTVILDDVRHPIEKQYQLVLSILKAMTARSKA